MYISIYLYIKYQITNYLYQEYLAPTPHRSWHDTHTESPSTLLYTPTSHPPYPHPCKPQTNAARAQSHYHF